VLQVLEPAYQRYSAVELLRDGRSIEIRALRPDDEERMLAALSRISPASIYRRFLGVKKGFSESERAFYLKVNFTDHVALVATLVQSSRTEIVGGARYVAVGAGIAELAFMVADDFQGQGIGSALMRHLTLLARRMSLKQLVADVLPENTAMLNVFKKSGSALVARRDKGVIRVTLDI
jgi:RimJ/RimL family protein N-acetyltransferase